jgi:uncharacterized protein (UPF0548 family)
MQRTVDTRIARSHGPCRMGVPTKPGWSWHEPTKPGWSWHEPTREDVAAFLAAQRDATWSYPDVGSSATNERAPAGYNLDHNRVKLGEGATVFESACAALRAWKMFPAPWTRISPSDAPIESGRMLAMQAHALGVWWLNACRIVYLIDEHAPVRRFGFAYGTLPAHVEEGEERFSVELHADGGVWYDLRAFSRPRYWPVRLAKPIARRLQMRFVRESQGAMKTAATTHIQARVASPTSGR